jgi:hypothetical protein
MQTAKSRAILDLLKKLHEMGALDIIGGEPSRAVLLPFIEMTAAGMPPHRTSFCIDLSHGARLTDIYIYI